ncbi:CHAT domain-containing protein [Amycolatopsis sp. NPDC051061]|uniref:CHAT domain-containing protein n=1 Tax=Amycolatopsis sp. NPDC051061 TaxID=3155042 RepID=UPI00341F8E25
MAEALLDALRSRLRRFDAGNVDDVMVPEAAGEARELVHSLSMAWKPAEAFQLAGWLLWYRCMVAPDGPDPDELTLATKLLVHYRHSGGRVPSAIEELYADSDGDLDTALERLPRYHYERGLSQFTCFERTGNRQCLVEATRSMRAAREAFPTSGAERYERLFNLGTVSWHLHLETGDLDAAADAVASLREAALADTGAIDAPRVLAVLASALVSLHRATGDPALAAEAVTAGRQAVARTPHDHPLYAQRASDTAELCFQEWRRTRADPALLGEAVELYRSALRNLADHVPAAGRGDLAFRFAYALRAHLSAAGGTLDPADLREAADAYRTAADLLPPDDPWLPLCLSNLANTLIDLHQLSRSPEGAAAAVDAARAAVDATPRDDPRLAHRQAVLSQALGAQSGHQGSHGALDEAIELQRTAARADTDPGLRAKIHYNLGSELAERYARTLDPAVLEEAITMRRLGLAEVPVDDPEQRAVHLAGLGMLLQTSYELTGSAQSADESLGLLREAVETAPPHHPERAMLLTELAAAVRPRLRQDGEPGSLDEAIALHREAVHHTAAEDPRRGSRLAQLADLLLQRYDDRAAREDLDAAIATVHHALDHRGGAGGDDPVVLEAAARVKFRHYQRTGSTDSLRDAVGSGRRLARMEIAYPNVRVRGAITWAAAAWEAGRPAEAAEAGAFAVESLAAAGRHELTEPHRMRLLTRHPSVASDAAAYALRNADPEGALRLLEHGRGILLGDALENGGALADHDEVHELQRRHPEVWERFLAWNLRQWVHRFAARMDSAEPHMVVPYEMRHAVAREGGDVLGEIRTLPGFHDFLRPLPVRRLLHAARRGPVVVVNVSSVGSDALLLTADKLMTVPLSGLTPESVAGQVVALQEAIVTAHAGGRPSEASEAVHGVLSWLWDHVTGPVLDALGPAAAGRPRMWWCPTGLLAFLPLHAAGHHRRGTGDTVLDRVVSSYTPLVHALLRHSGPGRPVPEELLVVAMPRTPGHPDLPAAAQEEHLLRTLFPKTRGLSGEAATKKAVLNALKSAPWVHLACHAQAAGGGSPLGAHLLLHDGELVLRDVSDLRLHGAELAFLAACDTARGSMPLADESLHVAAAFQLAGYRQVIATMWPTPDRAAAALTVRTYDILRTRGDGPAHAVREATIWARQRRPEEPWLWAAHCHFGP